MKTNGSDSKKVKGVVRFASELESLRNVGRSGWQMFNVPDGERDSVAEHVTSATQIAFILAKCEGLSEKQCERAVLMTLFHDNDETRLGDMHWPAQHYLKKPRASRKALKDQVASLPKNIRETILELHEELSGGSAEAIVARDADHLECALRALIFVQRGFGTQEVVENSQRELQTESAKRILKQAIEEKDFANCWHREINNHHFLQLSKEVK